MRERFGGRGEKKAVVMYGVVLYTAPGSVCKCVCVRWGCWRSVGQIIRPVLRDEGWPTCKQVTSVLDDNS